MKALVFICQKSIFLREQELKKKDKEEEADEVKNIEQEMILNQETEDDGEDILSDEDDEDDEDFDCNDYNDRDLYDSRLDTIDEVIMVRDTLATL